MEEEVTYAGRTSTGRKPMREILFRGKRIEDKEWVYGTYMAHDRDGHTIFNQNLGDGTLQGFEVIPETVGQSTGLKDRNGVDIYEGDIANHKDYECFGKVVFSDDELAFAFLVVTGLVVTGSNNKGPTTEFEWLYEYADGLEVIGNIHDNPELMEVRK